MVDHDEIVQRKKHVLLVELGIDYWSREIVENLRLNDSIKFFGTGSTAPTDTQLFENFLVRGNPHESGLDVTDDIIRFTVDKELYGEIRSFEGATIRMLDRVDGFRLWQHNDVSKRRNYFFRETAFWSNYLKETRIDAVVFANIPHEGFDFIIYNLCVTRRIPTLILFHTFNIHTFAFTVTESIESAGDFAVASDLKARFEYSEPQDFQNRLRNDFLGNEPFDRVIANQSDLEDREPVSVGVPQKATELQNGANTFERFVRRFLRYRTQFEYKRVKKSKALPGHFVFFPLHVEPELAISPSGGHFEEQHEAIRFLASKLPEGWKVVVKEHPHQAGFGPRPAGFYKRISAIPNVEFVKTQMSSLDVIAKCQTVVTITGSAGIEAVRLGKPSWVLGYPWYLSSPGVTRIDTSEDLTRAFENLFNHKSITSLELEEYVTSLHGAHFYGFIPGFPDHASRNELAGIKQSTVTNVVSIINKWLEVRFDFSVSRNSTR